MSEFRCRKCKKTFPVTARLTRKFKGIQAPWEQGFTMTEKACCPFCDSLEIEMVSASPPDELLILNKVDFVLIKRLVREKKLDEALKVMNEFVSDKEEELMRILEEIPYTEEETTIE